ncbi:MAG TPA: GxxExxY protein [Gemmatimonadaceae bacterium]|nr:GxxExxY protein [Gemmatimonadaceae bacterium]
MSRAIIGAFYGTYNELGFGFLEPIYGRGLEILLRDMGLDVRREYPIQIHFRGQVIGHHRCDMLVEGKVIVEIKGTEILPESSKRQLRNYLAALRLGLGMLLHFGPRANYHSVLGPRTVGAHQTDQDASGESGSSST